MLYRELEAFLKVVEWGSFTQAAQHLKAPKSRVSRAVARLEDELGVQLLRRTTRQTRPTEAGLQLFQKTHTLLGQLQQELENVSTSACEVSGSLRIAAPEDFGEKVLGPLLPRFVAQYPEMCFELRFSNHYSHLIAEDIDVAFRIGTLEDSNLIQRRLSDVEVILVASPDYLQRHGRPTALNELGPAHKLLSFYSDNPQAPRHFAQLIPELQAMKVQFQVNHFGLLVQWALQGQGLATVPDFYVQQELKRGELVRILPDQSFMRRPLHLLYPPMPQMPLRIRRFIDFVVLSVS